jgi:DNA repair protein RadC
LEKRLIFRKMPLKTDKDGQITTRLKSALALIDVRVLDHIVVTVDDSVSLAQRGHL